MDTEALPITPVGGSSVGSPSAADLPARMLKVDLGPVAVTTGSLQAALEYTDALIRRESHHYFCFCEASLLSSLIRDHELATALHTAEAIFPDGVALVALARLRGYACPPRIPGPSFLLAAAEFGVSRGWRHYLYGGAPGVADQLASRLRRDYPGIIIAGTCSPPFRPLTEAEETATKQLIESSKPHLLWVALGSPKQERWCAEQLGRIHVPVMLAVGAAFDFHSGNRPWAPAWIRKVGMEWAFRTVTGGRRTLFRNLRCVSLVGFYMFKVAWARLWSGAAPRF